MAALSFLYSQLFVEPPVPEHDFSGQTIIVTGANRGLGLEAARHLVRLNAATVVLAVRSERRGHEAAAALEQSTGRRGAVRVCELDMASQQSVERFAAQMDALDRLDAVVLNAGIYTPDFVLADGHESTLTVNVVNTFLLALLLLALLRRSSREWHMAPRVSIVASDRHVMTTLPEWKADKTFEVLDDEKTARMDERYYVSKLLQILFARALATRLGPGGGSSSPQHGPRVVVNSLTPGLCRSGLTEKARSFTGLCLWMLTKATARTAEVGGRTLVAAVAMGEESHGKYLNDGRVDESALSPFVRSDEGAVAQEKLWRELMDILEQKHPGIGCLLADGEAKGQVEWSGDVSSRAGGYM